MRGFIRAAVAALVFLLWTSASAVPGAELSPEIVAHLEKDPYVYIASTRKSGELGTAAEIWFDWDGKAVVVGTSTSSYRVRRIRAGRPAARIWVGGTDGAWFGATGAVVDGKAAQDAMIAAFAEKYGDTFTGSWQEKFRAGFARGDRVVVRYTPTAATGVGPTGLPEKK